MRLMVRRFWCVYEVTKPFEREFVGVIIVSMRSPDSLESKTSTKIALTALNQAVSDFMSDTKLIRCREELNAANP